MIIWLIIHYEQLVSWFSKIIRSYILKKDHQIIIILYYLNKDNVTTKPHNITLYKGAYPIYILIHEIPKFFFFPWYPSHDNLAFSSSPLFLVIYFDSLLVIDESPPSNHHMKRCWSVKLLPMLHENITLDIIYNSFYTMQLYISIML